MVSRAVPQLRWRSSELDSNLYRTYPNVTSRVIYGTIAKLEIVLPPDLF